MPLLSIRLWTPHKFGQCRPVILLRKTTRPRSGPDEANALLCSATSVVVTKNTSSAPLHVLRSGGRSCPGSASRAGRLQRPRVRQIGPRPPTAWGSKLVALHGGNAGPRPRANTMYDGNSARPFAKGSAGGNARAQSIRRRTPQTTDTVSVSPAVDARGCVGGCVGGGGQQTSLSTRTG